MRARVLIVTVALVAVWAPAASATSLYNRVLHVYQSSGGTIPPCTFSSTQLESVLKGADTYETQYFADFSNAINAALSQRASGACGRVAGSVPVQTGSSSNAPPLKLGPVTAATGAPVPAPIVLLAVLGGLLLLATGIGVLAQARGWDPAWATGWRHAWQEAGYRIAGRWAGLGDRWRSR
jgi:hypothetical protein